MSYIDLNLTEEETLEIIEGKRNSVLRLAEELVGKDQHTRRVLHYINRGDYTRVGDRMYRVCWIMPPFKPREYYKEEVGLGFMGMYGDEE